MSVCIEFKDVSYAYPFSINFSTYSSISFMWSVALHTISGVSIFNAFKSSKNNVV